MNDCLTPWQWTAKREISGRLTYGSRLCDAYRKSYGSASRLHRGIYERVQCVYSTESGYSSHVTPPNDSGFRSVKGGEAGAAHLEYGGIFNFDFSRDGSTLVCACERKTLAVFDPHNRRLITAKTDAHNDCVNGIRFIDRHTFCSCSDDRTVRIWDLRNLAQPKSILQGHEHWVKNVEYVDGCLVSSGFDGKILLWSDIIGVPSPSEPHSPQLLFRARNLMRTAINPVSRTLAMSTNSGYIMVVHDLDLASLADDLRGFKPHVYQLMQMTRTPIRNAHAYSHLFDKSRTRNRVELVADFAESNDAELISSLKIHPQGWCMLSRNTSSDRSSEYTSVHDIRSEPVILHGDDYGYAAAAGASGDNQGEALSSYTVSISIEQHQRQVPRSPLPYPAAVPTDLSSGSSRVGLQAVAAGRKRRIEQRGQSMHPLHFAPAAVADASEEEEEEEERRREHVISRVLPSAQERMRNAARRTTAGRRADTLVLVVQYEGDGRDRTLVIVDDDDDEDANAGSAAARIHENEARLAYYIEEPNMMHGFIKEQCFSHDGRFMCSPFAHGFRLLAFDDACDEPFVCGTSVPFSSVPRRRPAELKEVTSCYSHQNVVVSCAMSPVEPLIVTGCLGGQVCFHQPVL